MSKQKKKKDKHEDCLFVTPLSIDDCLLRLEAMENSELDVSIEQDSADYVEVRFMERHKDDLAIYGVSCLIPIDTNLTCVTFKRILKRHGRAPNHADIAAVHLLETLDKRITWIALLLGLILFLSMPQEIPALIVALFIALSIRPLKHVPEPPTSRELSMERESHMKEQRREDELRADLYHALQVDDVKAKIDELGDAYYVESPKSKTGDEHE